jgi:hypothetical protein
MARTYRFTAFGLDSGALTANNCSLTRTGP